MTETSRIANQNAASFRQDHCQRILTAIKIQPGLTAGEIGQVIMMPKVAVSRRLPELERDGAIYRDTARACTCDGCSSRQLTWVPAQAQENLFDVSPLKKW